ncbi:hypothetical protein D3C72_1824460 [compost metagenome]
MILPRMFAAPPCRAWSSNPVNTPCCMPSIAGSSFLQAVRMVMPSPTTLPSLRKARSSPAEPLWQQSRMITLFLILVALLAQLRMSLRRIPSLALL